MKSSRLILFLFIFISFFLINCSGGGGGSDSTDDDTSDTVNTAKLVGTPFEGLETGDDFDWDFFVCGNFQTETVDSLPIQIFAAFFTEAEEETIQEGIDIVNTAMGEIVYELTNTCTNDARVIYKVDNIAREDGFDPIAAGQTLYNYVYFNDHAYSETVVTDWGIELQDGTGVTKWVVAHELGHASGIRSHDLINYENDEILSDEPNNGLEENSLMQADVGGSAPQLTDYTYMMGMQDQIFENHLSDETGTANNQSCDF